MRRGGEIERAARHTHTSHMRARGHEHATNHGREVPYSNGRAVVAGPVVNLWRWCLRSIVLQLRVGRRAAALLAGMVLIGGAAVRTGECVLQRCAVLRVTIPPAVNRAQPRRGLALPMPHDDAKLMS